MPTLFTQMIVLYAALLSTGGAFGEDKIENHPHDFAQDIDAFHAVLAPLWHSLPDKQRVENICTQANNLENQANNIQSSDATALRTSIAVLKQKCQAGTPEIEVQFTQVHQAFHDLVEHK